MEHMREEIVVQAPIDHVWQFYCDTSRWRDWMPRMESAEFSGPVDQIGTEYVMRGKMLGFEFKGKYRIVEVEPHKLIHEHTSDNGVQDNYLRFEREGDATRLILDSDYTLPAHLPGFMTRGFFERSVRNMLADFKALAEATVPVPA
jgi:uncharacterized membrane protein